MLPCDTNCRLEDTLYLEVTAPSIRPGLLVISDHGRTTVEFGSVGTGESDSINLTVPWQKFTSLRECLSPSPPMQVTQLPKQ